MGDPRLRRGHMGASGSRDGFPLCSFENFGCAEDRKARMKRPSEHIPIIPVQSDPMVPERHFAMQEETQYDDMYGPGSEWFEHPPNAPSRLAAAHAYHPPETRTQADAADQVYYSKKAQSRLIPPNAQFANEFGRGGAMEGQEFQADAAARMDAMGLLEEILVRDDEHGRWLRLRDPDWTKLQSLGPQG